jgi:hypothetical protein
MNYSNNSLQFTGQARKNSAKVEKERFSNG